MPQTRSHYHHYYLPWIPACSLKMTFHQPWFLTFRPYLKPEQSLRCWIERIPPIEAECLRNAKEEPFQVHSSEIHAALQNYFPNMKKAELQFVKVCALWKFNKCWNCSGSTWKDCVTQLNSSSTPASPAEGQEGWSLAEMCPSNTRLVPPLQFEYETAAPTNAKDKINDHRESLIVIWKRDLLP